MSRSALEIAPGIVLGGENLPVIAGPCAVETAEITLKMARALAEMTARLKIQPIFKASFDKANRSSIDSFRSIGFEPALEILAEVKRQTGLAVLTDVHEPHQCGPVAEVCDVLQIPAFLCRQTDLLIEAAKTGRAVNLKKGQFIAPSDMPRAVEKVTRQGNEKVFVTERGTSFGYNNLVVDMRAFKILQQEGIHVIFDVTHSLQLPGGGKETGGAREFAEPLAYAAIAAGADGVFVEMHPDPSQALSDSTTQLDPERAGRLLKRLVGLRAALREPQG